MNIAQFAVTRPVAVIMRIAALVLLGAICLTRLPVDLLPKVTLPTVAVITPVAQRRARGDRGPGHAPDRAGGLLRAEPVPGHLEQHRGQLAWSGSSSSGARISGRRRWMCCSWSSAPSGRFPTDPTLQNPIVFKFDPTQMPILIFGVSGEHDPVKLRTLLDNQVSPMIESADGVASATVTGGQQRAIIVDVDPDRLRAHHMSLCAT